MSDATTTATTWLSQAAKDPRVIAASGTLLVSSALYYAYGPSKHPQIPNLNAPYSVVTGHLAWLQEGAEKKCLQERINDAVVASKSYQKCLNMSLPLDYCKIITTDPEIIKYVFETDFESFEKGDTVREQWIEVLGEGIFMSDPPKKKFFFPNKNDKLKKKKNQWKLHRKAASRMFSMRNLKQHMFDCAILSSKETVQKLKELNEIESNQVKGIDISDILGRFTLDSFIEICFGKSVGIVKCAPEKHEFCDAFDESVIQCTYRYFDPLWKAKRFFGFKSEQKMLENEKILNDFVNKLLDLETVLLNCVFKKK
ncbi:hypothetical protein RFI_02466 [Reticulomyxa filosa]|uniref:Uncharacterized protein n=1 Tax=Reticulomyxa filosa TaxID=46433 RepID=X6P8V5_RETFI|nr:hypothetical protein RFI_02466 [Reticulomyxa filosa]|eukprot:ETO34626.1 hypothetical protein RFI_02466 [Reticulomyxa filosa]